MRLLLLLFAVIFGDAATVDVALTIDAPGAPGGTLVLRSLTGGAETRRELDAQALAKLRSIRVAPGEYELRVDLPGHALAERTIDARNGATAVGRIAVPRLPVVRGVVVKEDGRPAAGAKVTLAPGNVSATTGADGSFAVTTARQWPDKAVVSLPGFGTKYLAVPKVQSDVDLKQIELRRAAAIEVTLDRTAYAGPVSLAVMSGDTAIAYGYIDAAATRAELRDVDPGFYSLVARGEGPLERIAVRAGLVAGELHRVTVAPKPRDVRLRVTRAGAPLPHADVTLTHATARWRTTVSVGADGTTTTPLWEPGDFEIAVRGSGLTTPHTTRRPLRESELAIAVPDGAIAGTVTDISGNAVAHAVVLLRTTRDGGSTTVRTATDDRGHFRFTAVAGGAHSLNVDAPGFLKPEPVPAAIGADARVVLERGLVRHVRVVGSDNAPVAGAVVACATGSALRSTAVTDEEGRAEVATPIGSATLFAIPKEGSFAFRRIGSDDRSIRIDVPAAAASLEVATLTTEGQPLSGIAVLMRYNGEVVPPELGREIERQQGIAMKTDDAGRIRLAPVPRGVYELWPYRSPAEADALLASVSALEAPANVNVVTGENRVTIRFRPRR